MKDSVINESKDNSRKEERQTEYLETMEDSSETLPFQVEIDKTSLEIRKEKEATALLFTVDRHIGTIMPAKMKSDLYEVLDFAGIVYYAEIYFFCNELKYLLFYFIHIWILFQIIIPYKIQNYSFLVDNSLIFP